MGGETKSSAWDDSFTISSKGRKDIGLNMPKSIGYEEIKQKEVQINSSFSSSSSKLPSDPFAPCSALPIPIDISTMPELKSKPSTRETQNEVWKDMPSQASKLSSQRISSPLRPLRTKNGKIIDKDLALSLGLSEEEYVQMVSSSDTTKKCTLAKESFERIELKRSCSLTNITNQIISLKRSISDSTIKLR